MFLQYRAPAARRRAFLGALWRPLALSMPALLWSRPSAAASRLSGAGASFPAKVYQRWGARFAELTHVQLDYQATGSGDGVKQAIARKVALAGTDAPLSVDELRRQRLVQLPMLVGGVVPVVNLPELGERRLRLSGPLLADILLGVVTRWDDPRIVELNTGLPLPSRRIQRVVRSDKSGTTEGLTRYLAAVSPAFRAAPGMSTLPAWPGEVLRAPGNDGVSVSVRATSGSIGYVSHDRVEADRLSPVQLRNRDGYWVSAGEAGFKAAIQASDLYRLGDDLAPLVDQAGPASWPITLTSFVLLDAVPPSAAAVEDAMRFVWWCFMHGDQLTRGSGFAPLPVAVQARLVGRMDSIQPQQGPRPAYRQL